MEILKLQRQIQERFAAERGMQNPTKIVTVGQFVDYVREMREFLNAEIQELLDEVDVTKGAQKPWKSAHFAERAVSIRDDMRSSMRKEAIDALCFMMNICLAAGVTEDNIVEVYNSVHKKNISRIEEGY